MTKDEIKQAILEANLQPSDVFAVKELEGDTAIVQLVRTAKQQEYEHAKRVEKQLGEERTARAADTTAAEEAQKGLKDQMSALQTAANSSLRATALDSVSKTRKLSDVQRKFVDRNLDSFNSDAKDEAGLAVAMETFVAGQIKEFDEIQTLLGKAPDDKGDKGTPPGDGKPPADGADLTVPANNPLIPQAEKTAG